MLRWTPLYSLFLFWIIADKRRILCSSSFPFGLRGGKPRLDIPSPSWAIRNDPQKLKEWAYQVISLTSPRASVSKGSRRQVPSPISDQGTSLLDATSINQLFFQIGKITADYTSPIYCDTPCYWLPSPDGLYYIPYVIDEEYVDSERATILDCMRYFEVSSNIRFVKFDRTDPQKNPHYYYVRIVNDQGCSSFVGRQVIAGEQIVSLKRPDCLSPSVIRHEFGHLLGLDHEHQRPDRDDYIRILYENIKDNVLDQFSAFNDSSEDLPPVVTEYSYDFASIMHYTSVTFSKNGGLTLDALEPQYSSGIRYSHSLLSVCDWNKISTLYPGKTQPPRCTPHSRGHQTNPTKKCIDYYGLQNCDVACHFSATDLVKSGLCAYVSDDGRPPPAYDIAPHPLFPTDADHSSDNSEFFWRTFLVRFNYLGEDHYL